MLEIIDIPGSPTVRSTLEKQDASAAFAELQAAQGPMGLPLHWVTVSTVEVDATAADARTTTSRVPRLCGGVDGVIPERVAQFNASRIG